VRAEPAHDRTAGSAIREASKRREKKEEKDQEVGNKQRKKDHRSDHETAATSASKELKTGNQKPTTEESILEQVNQLPASRRTKSLGPASSKILLKDLNIPSGRAPQDDSSVSRAVAVLAAVGERARNLSERRDMGTKKGQESQSPSPKTPPTVSNDLKLSSNSKKFRPWSQKFGSSNSGIL